MPLQDTASVANAVAQILNEFWKALLYSRQGAISERFDEGESALPFKQ